MQDYFETIEEKDQICKEKPKHCTAMLLIQKASSDRSLLNTLKLNLTSRRLLIYPAYTSSESNKKILL